MDAANILKPALARGELRSIGATTLDEYQKYFEKDKALERRFHLAWIEGALRESPSGAYQGRSHHRGSGTEQPLHFRPFLAG